jgi:hypothetical protein
MRPITSARRKISPFREREIMDDLQLLREMDSLHRLLRHYGAAAGDDREAWRDRVMHLDGVRPDELARLHGLLLAGDWLEQNTGATPVLQRGAVPACYRITSAGLRALRRVVLLQEEEDEETAPASGGR